MTLAEVILLALKASIVMTVLGFGLQAGRGDVDYLLRRPLLLGRSLLAMLVIMPIVAIALTTAFSLPPAVAIAMIALSIAPIPPVLPGKEQKAGGYASFGIGLQFIVAVLAMVSVPASVAIIGRYYGHPFAMASGAIAKLVLVTIVVPLAAGFGITAIWPAVGARVAKPLQRIAMALLVLGSLAILVKATPAVLALTGSGSVLVLGLFVLLGLATGHWLGGPDPHQRVVLALSTASRHPAIALTVAKANFPDEPNLVGAVLLYLLLSLVIEAAYLAWRRNRES